MARQLKTYQTSVGFFDLAVAAPSMKAAAEAWGTNIRDFKHGFARQSDDPEVVAATMAKPGVVLKRPVGSSGPFTEHAELPRDLPDKVKETSAKARSSKKSATGSKLDTKATRQAALAFEREQKARENARKKEEAAREKARKRGEQAVAKAEKALELAMRAHQAKVKKIERQRASLEKQAEALDARWEKQKEKLESALRRARE